MSPSGKAPDFDSGIRRFESCHPSHVGMDSARLRNAASLRLPSFLKLCSVIPPLPHRSALRWGPHKSVEGTALPTGPASLGSGGDLITDYDPLAQSVEQLPFKQWVRGSSPRRVTKKEDCPLGSLLFWCLRGDSNSLNHDSPVGCRAPPPSPAPPLFLRSKNANESPTGHGAQRLFGEPASRGVEDAAPYNPQQKCKRVPDGSRRAAPVRRTCSPGRRGCRPLQPAVKMLTSPRLHKRTVTTPIQTCSNALFPPRAVP